MKFLKKAKNEFGFNNVLKVDGPICYHDEVAKKDKVYFDFNGGVFFPHEASNSCGVLIAYLGKTSFFHNKQKTDKAGRILILDVMLDRVQYILINLYNANTET